MVDAPGAQGRRVITKVADHFNVTPEKVEAYIALASHTMNAESVFLKPGIHRYILLAVDPAGGGKRSDEAVVVFIIANNQYGLLTGCLLGAHHPEFPFSVVPMVFLLGLLTAVRAVKAELFRMHRAAGFPDAAFVMPPVLVLLENNFAYGAAVYVHLLYFLERKRLEHPELKDVDILFATPVYGMDEHLVQLLLDRLSKQKLVKELTEELSTVMKDLNTLWKSNRRANGWNLTGIKKQVNTKLKALKVRDIDLPPNIPQTTVETEVVAVLSEVVAALREINPNLAHDIQTKRAEEFSEPFALMFFLQEEIRVARATLASIELLIKEPQKRREDGGRDGQGHQHFRVQPWPAEHRVDPETNRISYPPGFYYDAKRSTFGMQTSELEKAMTFNYFVHLVLQSNHPMNLLMPHTRTSPGGPRTDNKCITLRQPANARVHNITPADDAFRCIVSQWANLQVEVDNKTNAAVHVTGKQPGPTGAGVQKDDMWMAFSDAVSLCA